MSRFLRGRISWADVPKDGLTHLGNVISLCLYRKGQYQVELILIPKVEELPRDGFSRHRHPDVDSYEFHLAGDINLLVNDKPIFTEDQIQAWLRGEHRAVPVRIRPEDWHYGIAKSPVAFLSIQKWADGVMPSTVGFNWEGEVTHPCQIPYAR